MRPYHDHVSIGNPGIVKVVRERVGSLIDLSVREAPFGSGGGSGLDHTQPIRVGCCLALENLVNGTSVGRPMEVRRRIR
jgi:hypothetical protein